MFPSTSLQGIFLAIAALLYIIPSSPFSTIVQTGDSASRSCGGNANTFENFFPANFLHVGYMLNGAWRTSVQAQVNLQARPSARDHLEVWALRKYLASARNNWYRGSQNPPVFSRAETNF